MSNEVPGIVTIRIHELGQDVGAGVPNSILNNRFRLVENDADAVDIDYFALFDQEDPTVERLFARLAAGGRRLIVALASEQCHPLIAERARELDGVVLCGRREAIHRPLTHLTGPTGPIGVDLRDILDVMAGRLGRLWEGRADDAAAVASGPELAAGVSVAYSPAAGLSRIDELAALLPRDESVDVVFQANAALTADDRAEALLMRRPEPRVDRSAALLSDDAHAAYRRHARARGYCDPFTPFVGDRYGRDDFPRLVYCGAAGAYGEFIRDERDDAAARRAAASWAADFAMGGGNGGRFWTLLHSALAAVDPQPARSRLERMRRVAWTNLSKLNAPETPAPPDGDTDLRALDVAQMRREIAALDPDILLCVSGGMVLNTGRALFDALEPIDFTPSVSQTQVARLPNGGVLYWTMHPQARRPDPNGWMGAVADDVRRLIPMRLARPSPPA